jgi:hypothetical protein
LRSLPTSRSPATRVIPIPTYGSGEMNDLISESSAVGFLPKSRLSGDAVRALLSGDQREASSIRTAGTRRGSRLVTRRAARPRSARRWR